MAWSRQSQHDAGLCPLGQTEWREDHGSDEFVDFFNTKFALMVKNALLLISIMHDFLIKYSGLTAIIIIFATIIAFSPILMDYHCEIANMRCILTTRSVFHFIRYFPLESLSMEWLFNKMPFVFIFATTVVITMYKLFGQSKKAIYYYALFAATILLFTHICSVILLGVSFPYVERVDLNDSPSYFTAPY